jgi:hypothetical protein
VTVIAWFLLKSLGGDRCCNEQPIESLPGVHGNWDRAVDFKRGVTLG